MKIWVKFLIGTVIGLLLGIFIPFGTESSQETLSFLTNLIINIGRYSLFPLVFFSLAMGTYELKQEKHLIKVFGRLILYMAVGTALLSVIGAVTAFIIPLERIPIIVEQDIPRQHLKLTEILLNIFPKNLFKVFFADGNFLFPIYFLALFLGLNFAFDRLVTRPATQFFDSMSRIFYHINSFILEVLGFGFIILSAYFIVQIKGTEEIDLFKQLFIILLIDTGIIVFGVFPAILYFFGGKENPYKWLYAIIGPALAGFLSRDSYFSLAVLVKHGKENLGVPRSVGSTGFPLLAIFGKAGTALVTTISFAVVLTSYSSLGIGFTQLLWVAAFSFLFSFTLGTAPGSGVFIALANICVLYGRGIEQGYLILRPVLPLLISFGIFLDVITSALVVFLTARHEEVQKDIEATDFI
jgi:Na+/H+-dicarboxylate symporter